MHYLPTTSKVCESDHQQLYTAFLTLLLYEVKKSSSHLKYSLFTNTIQSVQERSPTTVYSNFNTKKWSPHCRTISVIVSYVHLQNFTCLQQDSIPWPLGCRCSALITDVMGLDSHSRHLKFSGAHIRQSLKPSSEGESFLQFSSQPRFINISFTVLIAHPDEQLLFARWLWNTSNPTPLWTPLIPIVVSLWTDN